MLDFGMQVKIRDCTRGRELGVVGMLGMVMSVTDDDDDMPTIQVAYDEPDASGELVGDFYEDELEAVAVS